jgi:hypothetical protein
VTSTPRSGDNVIPDGEAAIRNLEILWCAIAHLGWMLRIAPE